MVIFHNFSIAFCMFTRGYRALKEVVVDCGGFSYQTETLEARGSLAPWHLGREEGKRGVLNHGKVMKSTLW